MSLNLCGLYTYLGLKEKNKTKAILHKLEEQHKNIKKKEWGRERSWGKRYIAWKKRKRVWNSWWEVQTSETVEKDIKRLRSWDKRRKKNYETALPLQNLTSCWVNFCMLWKHRTEWERNRQKTEFYSWQQLPCQSTQFLASTETWNYSLLNLGNCINSAFLTK